MFKFFLPLTPKLFLTAAEVPKPTKEEKVRGTGINHIWEIDRSGSMHYLLPALVEDLKAKCKQLPLGDTVTVGWFSGTGDREFILKGYRLDDQTDYAVLGKIFDKLKESRGATCFSEILADTDAVIAGLQQTTSNDFTLVLFTDGYPVVSNYGREIEAIETALQRIKGRLTASLIVGYGDYYNKELLTSMAAQVGGSLVHSSDLATFNVAFSTFVTDAAELSGKTVGVEVPRTASTYFTTNGKQVVELKTRSDGGRKLLVDSPVSRRNKDFVYELTTTRPDGTQVSLDGDALHKDKNAALVRGAYAAALLLTQRTKTDVALEVLGTLGDVALVDAVTNAFTNAEYGAAEDKIRAAMAAPSKRFAAGRNTAYVPPANAYSLLDLLDDLREASLLPAHPDFEYKRIGRSAKPVGDFGKLVAAPNNMCALDDFAWNDERLNLSVRVQLRGTVELKPRDGKKPEDFGLLPVYPAFAWRNYTIVKDGALNVTRLPVAADREVLQGLQARGVVDTIHIDPVTNACWANVELSRIPVVNREAAVGRTSAKTLCKAVWQELEVSGKLKALKYFRDDLLPAKVAAADVKTDDAQGFLLANGIDIAKGGLFQPPTEAIEGTDSYVAKTFRITVKGFSSLPSVNEVVAAMDALQKDPKAKALKPAQKLVAAGVKLYRDSEMASEDPKVALAWLGAEIAKLQKTQRDLNRTIQEAKFAVILGKKWFDEFTTRDNPTLDVDGQTFTFKLGEKTVEL